MAKSKTKKTSVGDTVKSLMERYEVNVLYENSKGEFFLNKNLALNSEKGKEDKITEHKK